MNLFMARLVVLALCATTVAGCTEGEKPRTDPGAAANPRSFDAGIIGADGEITHLRLGQPVRIIDRYQRGIDAYPLYYSPDPTFDPDNGTRIVHLDNKLRIVRHDDPCDRKIENQCEYYDVSFDVAGMPAPWGVGLGNLPAGRSNLDTYYRHVARPTTVEVGRADGETTAVVDDWPSDASNRAMRVGGTYHFDVESTMAPSAIWRGEDETPVRRIYYIDRGPLPPLPASSPRFSSGEAAWPDDAARLFPGDDQEGPGGGYTYRGLMEWFLDEEADAASLLERGGCVTAFLIGRQTMDARPTGSVPNLHGHVRIQGSQGDHVMWRVRSDYDPLGQLSWKIVDSHEVPTGPLCMDLRDSPSPRLEASLVFEINQTIPVATEYGPSLNYWLGRGLSAEGSVGVGLAEYRLVLTPHFVELGVGVVTYRPYTITASAFDGALIAVEVDPPAVAAWDASGGSPQEASTQWAPVAGRAPPGRILGGECRPWKNRYWEGELAGDAQRMQPDNGAPVPGGTDRKWRRGQVPWFRRRRA